MLSTPAKRSRKGLRFSIALLLALASMLAGVPWAWGQQALEVSVSSMSIAPGDTITVSGRGCAADSRVTVAANVGVDGIIVESTANQSGEFFAELTIDQDFVEPGQPFQVVVSCLDTNEDQQTVSVEMTVGDEGRALPLTGLDPGPLALLGAGLLSAGVAIHRRHARERN